MDATYTAAAEGVCAACSACYPSGSVNQASLACSEISNIGTSTDPPVCCSSACYHPRALKPLQLQNVGTATTVLSRDEGEARAHGALHRHDARVARGRSQAQPVAVGLREWWESEPEGQSRGCPPAAGRSGMMSPASETPYANAICLLKTAAGNAGAPVPIGPSPLIPRC